MNYSWRLSHIHYNHKAFLQHKSSDVWQRMHHAYKLSHNDCIHTLVRTLWWTKRSILWLKAFPHSLHLWSFPSMSSLVLSPVCAMAEGFTAHIKNIGFHTSMNNLMLPEVSNLEKHFSTIFACGRFLSHMSSQMLDQPSALDECFLTHTTFIGLLPSMGSSCSVRDDGCLKVFPHSLHP